MGWSTALRQRESLGGGRWWRERARGREPVHTHARKGTGGWYEQSGIELISDVFVPVSVATDGRHLIRVSRPGEKTCPAAARTPELGLQKMLRVCRRGSLANRLAPGCWDRGRVHTVMQRGVPAARLLGIVAVCHCARVRPRPRYLPGPIDTVY